VVAGTEYAVFITNPSSGLWMYEMGDVIKFVDIDTYNIEICTRVHESSNIANEHVELTHIEEVLGILFGYDLIKTYSV